LEREHALIRDLALNNQKMEQLAEKYGVALQTVYFVDPVSCGLGQPLLAVATVEP
jgi:hypothetical protein